MTGIELFIRAQDCPQVTPAAWTRVSRKTHALYNFLARSKEKSAQGLCEAAMRAGLLIKPWEEQAERTRAIFEYIARVR